jgi:hypothetical protein
MQPYFFPYIGYFALINATDQWVVFDDIQYIRHGWINRNRILHPNPKIDFLYIIVPLIKHSRNDKICDIQISSHLQWKDKIIGQVSHYKKKAPNYEVTIELIEKCFAYQNNKLNEFITYCIENVCEYLEINFDYIYSSNINFNRDRIYDPGEWALAISKKQKADVYINPIGGKEIFNSIKFQQEGIEIKFLKLNEIHYNQFRDVFIPNLSIIDVMMFNDIDTIKEYITNNIVVE